MQGQEAERLLSILRDEIRKQSAGVGHAAILFSGGLDSSIVAQICRENTQATLYTVGTAGSHDIAASVSGDLRPGSRLVAVVAADASALESAVQVRKLFREKLGIEPSHTEVSVYAPMYHLMQFVSEEHVFTGQGADELFGGYSRYVRMTAGERVSSMRRDAEKLLLTGVKRDKCVAEHFHKIIHFPYLSDRVAEFSYSLPPELKISGTARKVVLRECARLLSLTASEKEKKAMQYGSGFEKILRRS